MQTHCPACRAKFKWGDHWRFGFSWNGEPQVAPCPHCGARMALNRKASRLGHRAIICIAYATLTLLFTLWKVIPYDIIWPFLALAIPFQIYGYFLLARIHSLSQLEIITASQPPAAATPDTMGNGN